MSPDEEVTLTITREEAMRMSAALSALVQLQEMMGGALPSALALTEAVEVIKGVLPRLNALFPNDDTVHHYEVAKVPGEFKTSQPSAGPFDIKVNDLVGMSPQESAAIFGTQYDDSIRALLASLTQFTDYTQDDFNRLLDEHKALLKQTVRYPSNLSVKDSGPYVQLSDLITLGGLAHAMYERQDQIEDTSKPF